MEIYFRQPLFVGNQCAVVTAVKLIQQEPRPPECVKDRDMW